MGNAVSIFAAGSLSIAVSSGSINKGDMVTITVYAADSNNADVTSDMNVTYDTSKLEYISSSVTSATGGEGKVTATASDMSVKFKAIGSGDAYIKAEGASLTAAGTHIMISETAGNTSKEEKKETEEEQNQTKSGDNSLSSLKISAGTLTPEFKGSTTQYTATVGKDVNEITVAPVTSNSKATIVSITGNKNLKAGKNTVSVLVKAENGTEATYKIIVTKDDTVATAAETDSTTEPDGDKETEHTAESYPSGESIVIDGASYVISEDFTEEDIPQDFSRADFEYKGVPHEGVVFEEGHLGMYYLVNESGEGKFFVYDADRDGFYPYARLQNGEHFIILMVVPNGAIPPDGYEKTTLTLESVTIEAYQFADGENSEILSAEGDGADANIGKSDFYLFFAMDNTGVADWYQYDIKQGTYQRLNEEVKASEAEEGQNYDTLLADYNELSERYQGMKTKNRRWIVFFVFTTVLFFIVIINLILKMRDMRYEEDEEIEDNEIEPKERTRQTKDKQEKFSENIQGRVEKEEVMDMFEENPSLFRRKPRRMEPMDKTQSEMMDKKEYTKSETDDDDDDLEFFDLND